MTQDSDAELKAQDLFVRQLSDLSRKGADPNSTARLQEIFARSEAACRDQEERLASERFMRPVSETPAE